MGYSSSKNIINVIVSDPSLMEWLILFKTVHLKVLSDQA